MEGLTFWDDSYPYIATRLGLSAGNTLCRLSHRQILLMSLTAIATSTTATLIEAQDQFEAEPKNLMSSFYGT